MHVNDSVYLLDTSALMAWLEDEVAPVAPRGRVADLTVPSELAAWSPVSGVQAAKSQDQPVLGAQMM